MDRPALARAAPQPHVQKWPHRSVEARATVALLELRVELVWLGMSNNNDTTVDGGKRVHDTDGSSSFSSFLTTTS